jgi:hypothetical protein
MTALRIEGFAGIAPRYSERLLPAQNATIAANVKLVSGELRGLHEIKTIQDFSSVEYTVRRAFRIPADVNTPVPISGADTWIPFQDETVDFIRTPVQGDSFERYYWTGDTTLYDGVPKYNTRARLLAGSTPYRLGIPRPATAPTVTPPGGSAEVRYYVYTFVSAYGEEGQPSNPQAGTGDPGTWTISAIQASVDNPTQRNITNVNIYRTVPGLSTVEFFRVGTIALGTTTFNDTMSNEVAAVQPLLESVNWAPPPADLQGLAIHPAGFLIGFSGRDLYMSEPYRPHAWPIQNILTVQTEIVGLAIYNNTIVMTTNSHPYVAEGVSPASMLSVKLDSIDPCVSKRSIAVTLAGVFYASVQGIVQVSVQGTQLATRALFTREEWYGRYNPENVKAVPYGLQYIAFDTPQTGFIFSPAEQLAPLVELDRFNNVDGIQIDSYTGDVYVLRANRVALWDPLDTIPYEYQWRSKMFDLPRPVNFGAMRVKFRNTTAQLTDDAVVDYTTFNAARILFPLNTLNLAPLNTVKVEDIPAWPGVQNKTPVGGSPLFATSLIRAINPAVTVRVWARMKDSTFTEVFAYTITDEDVWRLPSDFMSDVWQFEFVGNTDIYSFAIAETAKELVQV